MSRIAFDILEEAITAVRLDEVTASLTYIGKAEIGTLNSANKWSVKRMQKAGNVTSIEWADGNGRRDNIWDNRASLTYS